MVKRNREYVNCEDEHLFAVIGFELSSRNFGSLYFRLPINSDYH